MVRTRFAPSPTGSLHLGNARTAALNWLYARQQDGAFILRFEDTDLERHAQGAERDIQEGLEWLGLVPDEGPFMPGKHGPYRQSERTEIYREHAECLLAEGRAYRCYCTPEELEARRAGARAERGDVRYDGRCRRLSSEEESRLIASGPPASIRFRVEPGIVHYRDRVRGDLTVDGEQLGDQVILRSDGRPTYNFAVVVDDLLMEISHVIRGAGHLSNTPKQVLLYEALGAVPPEFLHLPSVLAPGGGKLSKRAGAPGLLEYRDKGYHPDGLLNYLSLLSWSSPSGKEVLSRDQLVAEVDLDRIGAANPEVDPEKLRWLSGQHYRQEGIAVLERGLDDRLEGRFAHDARQLRALAEVLRERIQILDDADAICELVFPQPDLSSADAVEALREPTAGGALRQVAQRWETLQSWGRAELKEELAAAGQAAGLKGRLLYHPVRAALTGAVQGPDVPDVAYILGRETTAARLEAGLEAAEGGEAAEP